MIIGMPESGKNFIYRLFLKESIVENDTDEVLYINLNNISKEDNVIFELKRQNTSQFIKMQEVDNKLLSLCNQFPLTLILNLGDNRSINSNIISKLLQLRTRFSTSFTYVILGYTNVLNMINELNLKELLVKQVIPLLPVDRKDLLRLVERNSKQFNCNVSKKQIEKIAELSGGNPGLIKALVAQVSENVNWVDADISDQRLQQRLERLSDGLTTDQLKDLILNKTKTKSDVFLFQFGYINIKNDSEQVIFSKLYKEYVSSGKIKDGNVVDAIFTNQEEKILSLLKKNGRNITSRDDIAKIIWGDNFLDLYSDYAIDKHISNIRKKIKRIKSDIALKTVKGRGYYIN